MTTPARLRRATPGDAAGILELEAHFPGDRMSPASVRRLLRARTAEIVVALHGDRMDGAAVVLFRKNSTHARLYSLVVAPQARGTGLGSRLVAWAERSARRRGCTGLVLEVREDNRAARRLYRRLGYDERQLLPDYYDDGAPGLRLRRDFP